jgi:hypothetical protein
MFLAAAALARAEPSPAELEEAATVAVSTARNLARGRANLFAEAFDRTALLEAAVGRRLAGELTFDQRDRLSSLLLRVVMGELPAPGSRQADVQPVGTVEAGEDVLVHLLLPTAAGYLKTDWRLHYRAGRWRIEDVRLADMDRWLREDAVHYFGEPPLARRRNGSLAIRRAAVPRAAGLLGVAVVAFIFFRRTKGRDRMIVLLAAAGPALIFVLDGALAVSRVLREPIQVLADNAAPVQPWLERFQAAAARKSFDAAKEAAARAIALGARPQPINYTLGRLCEDRRDLAQSAAFYRKALTPPRPAPGGWAGLARVAMAQSRYEDVVRDFSLYFQAVAADPASLFLQAAAQGQLHEFEAAQETISRAIGIDPAAPELYALSARLAAADSDAGLAISRLREEEKLHAVDRSELSRDPGFAEIADRPEWKAFLAEAPTAAVPEPAPGPSP